MEDEIDTTLASSLDAKAAPSSEEPSQHVLLFYKFHPLAKDRATVEIYRTCLETLCRALDVQGRILVGCSQHQSEGINGTLSGTLNATQAFVRAMTRATAFDDEDTFQSILEFFWKECEEFYQKANCGPLIMEESEFKWSTCSKSQLFPDLNIKIVKELIGTGGVLASIPLKDVQQGYLTPEEWHERMAQLQNDEAALQNTVLIDCRNTKEWQIGHFPGAPDPSTRTFSQFPTWVQQNTQNLANKKVLMYCTGGIRCEKASAFIRNQIPSVKEVRHLQGGIHKYLDFFGSNQNDCLWKGKNFVFDGRGAHGAAAKEEEVVGKCVYCTAPYDVFQPGCVCTVCRDPTLVCDRCRPRVREYHCHNHFHMRTCYFTDLLPYTKAELELQLEGLRESMTAIAVGKKFKQKRKTVSKQCNKVAARIAELEGTDDLPSNVDVETKCRNCGETGCSGRCWGFHGLKRKRILEDKRNEDMALLHDRPSKSSWVDTGISKGNNSNLQQRKAQERQHAIDELVQLKLASPPSRGRDCSTGIRIPDSCTRELKTRVKGRWCTKTLCSVLQDEFPELAETGTLRTILESGLMRVNNKVISNMEEAEALTLKNMDIIGRILHWHEPPIRIPGQTISVKKLELPRTVLDEFDLRGDGTIFVCDKPASVPVHPAGPYLSNSLTIMVEAQEGLTPKSLIPCHRIDRATSGLTLCCTNKKIAHLVQSRMEAGFVSKDYLAKVQGRFPSCRAEIQVDSAAAAKWEWSNEKQGIQVDAPIETVDPVEGIRRISSSGKLSRSFFRFISFNPDNNTSIILCSPLTGRSHQLRVHLQWLGHSIVNDVLYGGAIDSSMDLTAGLLEAEQFRQRQDQLLNVHPATIADNDAEAAAKTCYFCTLGPEKAFSPAQLLRGGHEICLHAVRYRIVFHTRQGDSSDPIGTIDAQVEPPLWMSKVEGVLDKLSL